MHQIYAPNLCAQLKSSLESRDARDAPDTRDTRDTRDAATPRSMAGATLWRHSGCGDTAPATPGQMEAEL